MRKKTPSILHPLFPENFLRMPCNHPSKNIEVQSINHTSPTGESFKRTFLSEEKSWNTEYSQFSQAIYLIDIWKTKHWNTQKMDGLQKYDVSMFKGNPIFRVQPALSVFGAKKTSLPRRFVSGCCFTEKP